MSRSSSKTMDMVNGPLLKNVLLFSLPMMATSFLQILFNAMDTIIVGKFAGEVALAAVGATGSLCFLLTALFNGLSVGSNVIIATLLGSNDHEKIQKAVHTSISMATAGGILLACLGFFLSKPLLTLMSTPSDIIDLSVLYMRLYFCGSIFMLVYNFGASILRSKGDTKKPLYFLCISGVMNVVLNLVFVVFFHMSVAGVAIATVISQITSAILTTSTLMKEKDATHLDIRKLGIDLSVAWDIIRIGIPAGISGMVFSVSNVVIQSSINSFNSSIIVAGNSAGANIEGFVYIGMTAFSQAAITFTSQNVGAKNFKRIKEIVNVTLILTIIGGFTLGFTMWYFGEFFLGFYTNEMEVIQVGLIRLGYVALLLGLNGILDIFVSSMRGMGYSTLPTVLMIIGICGVRLIWIWTIFPLYPALETIYMCFPISWVVTGVIQAIFWYFCHKKLIKRNLAIA